MRRTTALRVGYWSVNLLLSEESFQNHPSHFALQTLFGGGYAGLAGYLLFYCRYTNSSFKRET